MGFLRNSLLAPLLTTDSFPQWFNPRPGSPRLFAGNRHISTLELSQPLSWMPSCLSGCPQDDPSSCMASPSNSACPKLSSLSSCIYPTHPLKPESLQPILPSVCSLVSEAQWFFMLHSAWKNVATKSAWEVFLHLHATNAAELRSSGSGIWIFEIVAKIVKNRFGWHNKKAELAVAWPNRTWVCFLLLFLPHTIRNSDLEDPEPIWQTRDISRDPRFFYLSRHHSWHVTITGLSPVLTEHLLLFHIHIPGKKRGERQKVKGQNASWVCLLSKSSPGSSTQWLAFHWPELCHMTTLREDWEL